MNVGHIFKQYMDEMDLLLYDYIKNELKTEQNPRPVKIKDKISKIIEDEYKHYYSYLKELQISSNVKDKAEFLSFFNYPIGEIPDAGSFGCISDIPEEYFEHLKKVDLSSLGNEEIKFPLSYLDEIELHFLKDKAPNYISSISEYVDTNPYVHFVIRSRLIELAMKQLAETKLAILTPKTIDMIAKISYECLDCLNQFKEKRSVPVKPKWYGTKKARESKQKSSAPQVRERIWSLYEMKYKEKSKVDAANLMRNEVVEFAKVCQPPYQTNNWERFIYDETLCDLATKKKN